MNRDEIKVILWPDWVNLEQEVKDYFESFENFVDEVILAMPEEEKELTPA